MLAYLVVLATLFGSLPSAAHAHEHDVENIPEGSVVSPDPLDLILWLHIAGMIVSFGTFLCSDTGNLESLGVLSIWGPLDQQADLACCRNNISNRNGKRSVVLCGYAAVPYPRFHFTTVISAQH